MDDDPWADAHTPTRTGTPADGAAPGSAAAVTSPKSPLSPVSARAGGSLDLGLDSTSADVAAPASPRRSHDAGAVLARLSLEENRDPASRGISAADAWATPDPPSPTSPPPPAADAACDESAPAEPPSDAPEAVASPPPGADEPAAGERDAASPEHTTEDPALAPSSAGAIPPADDDFADDFAEPPPAEGSGAAAADVPADDGFDDFDDFDAPAAAGDFDDEGFGDFGDFADADEAAGEPDAEPAPQPSEAHWATLNLRPVPPRVELMERVSGVLAPLVPDPASFTDEQPRSVGGLGQVLTSESSRDVYAQLTTAPMLKPLDWTRSRVRREHLIAMGVPVNLDEVDSHRLSALPPLLIKTRDVPVRTQSADPAGAPQRNSLAPAAAGAAAGAGAGPSSAPVTARNSENDKYGLGPRPPLDMAIAEELCGLEEDKLSLMPLSKLESIQRALVDSTADASALLAYLLQLKDALGSDSATYNGMISEMIANAAKQKQPSSGGGLFRRGGSRPTSMSAANTPGRVGSPSVSGAR